MLNKMQSKLLEMFEWLVSFLNKNGLTYYAIGGTLLGAIRHNGFIPWDDDVDIAMPREDYEKLVELLKEPVDHYVVESPKGDAKDFIYSFAKFYDLNTTMTEYAKINVTRGVSIDIFPLDGIGNDYAEAKKNYKKNSRLFKLLMVKVAVWRKGRKLYKNLAALLGYLIPVNVKKLTRKIDQVNRKIKYSESAFVGIVSSTYGAKEIFEKEVYGEPVLHKFEYIEINCPQHYEKVLEQIYGNWQQLPPEDKRVVHAYNNIDFNNSWKK